MIRRHQQQGFSLIVALVALVIMALAAVSLMRTVSTATLVSGNLAFEQAAVTSADAGTEAAIAWLENNTGVSATCPTGGGTTVLSCDQLASGYVSLRLDPTSTQNWATVWGILSSTGSSGTPATPQAQAKDAAGNTASYLIQRMCNQYGDASSSIGCSAAPSSAYCGNSKRQNSNAGAGNISCTSSTYYRITVQVNGPRGTVSYIQSMVAL